MLIALGVTLIIGMVWGAQPALITLGFILILLGILEACD